MDTLIISGGNIGIDLALGLLKIKRFVISSAWMVD